MTYFSPLKIRKTTTDAGVHPTEKKRGNKILNTALKCYPVANPQHDT